MFRILPLLAISILGLPTVSSGQDGVRGKVARVIAKTRDPIEMRRSLVFLGKEAIAPLFYVWLQERVPGEWRSDTEYEMRLNSEQLNVISSVFDSLAEADVYGFLDEIAQAETPREVRIKAVELVGQIGEASALRLLAALATPFEAGNGVIPRTLRVAFGAALQELLERKVITTRHIRELFVDVAPGLLAMIVQSLSEVPGPQAARSLAALLGRQPKLDPLILTKIAARERSANPLDDEDLRTAVRSLLNSGKALVLASAARTSGILGDENATEELVELVGHDDPSVRLNASAALKRITGLGFGLDSVRWQQWYEDETYWWDNDSPDVLVELETAEGVEFTRAIVTALKRRLYRDRIAASLVLRLRDTNGNHVRLACAALAQLRAHFAVTELIGCLDDDDADVREAAWKALRRITGKNLPPDAESWKQRPG